MALGDNNYSSNSNFDRITIGQYSEYGGANKNATLEASRLSYSFYGGTLRIAIAPKKEETPEGKVTFDYKNMGEAYLNHTKCRILRDAILAMREDPTIHNVGVPTGDKLISFSDGSELGIDKPVLIIRELDQQGQIKSAYIYEFKVNEYYYSVINFDASNSNYEKRFYNNIEVDQLIDQLDSYVKAMTGSYSYATVDALVNNKEIGEVLRNIASQVGVPQNTTKANYRNSYFNNQNNNSGSFRQGTINDIREG